jgi:hypothetical protein
VIFEDNMSSKKNIYEVFNEFKFAPAKDSRIAVLQANDSWALRNVLMGAMHPDIKFSVKKIPDWKKIDVPPGLSYNHMTDALSKIYLFMEGNPKTPPALTEKRKNELLIQLLESLEPKEAEIYCAMIMKDLKVPYLTPKLVNEAFKGLLPE